MNLELDMLYQMIDLINDTLVSIRFSVNQNVHFEVLLVKLAQQIKGQPQVITMLVEPAQIASSPNTRCIVATYGTVRARKLKTHEKHKE